MPKSTQTVSTKAAGFPSKDAAKSPSNSKFPPPQKEAAPKSVLHTDTLGSCTCVRLKVKYKPSSQPPQKQEKEEGIKSQQSRQTQDTKRHRRHFPTAPFSHHPAQPPGFFGGKGGVTEGLLMWFSHPTSPHPFQKRLTFHSRHDIFTLSLFVFFFRISVLPVLCCFFAPQATGKPLGKTLVELTFSGALKSSRVQKWQAKMGKLK